MFNCHPVLPRSFVVRQIMLRFVCRGRAGCAGTSVDQGLTTVWYCVVDDFRAATELICVAAEALAQDADSLAREAHALVRDKRSLHRGAEMRGGYSPYGTGSSEER